MNNAGAAQISLDTSTGSTTSSKRKTVWVSVLWAALFLLGSWYLSSVLGALRNFEPDIEFQAHNRIHWFRPITFFWFHHFSLLPSFCLAILICFRHKFPHSRTFVTWLLALITASLLVVGVYTFWEQLATMHQFTQ
jgi:hypothetical protein